MIPMPPSHAVNWRHIAIDRVSPSTSVSTVAPVVEKPDIDSKNASIGLDSWDTASRYGRAPQAGTRSQMSAITR